MPHRPTRHLKKKVHGKSRSHALFRDGILKIAPDGYGFVLAEARGDVDVFVPERFLRHAMHGDRVRVRIQAARGKKIEGHVEQVLERASSVMIGSLVRSPFGWRVLSRDGGRPFEIELVMAEQAGRHREGDIVAVKLVRYPAPGIEATGEILRVLGAHHDLPTLTHAVLLRRQIVREFPGEVREACRVLPDEVAWPGADTRERQDLTKLPLITIDGARARDFDDAVCVRQLGKDLLLTVAIADVAEYVTIGSSLDQEAYLRATSTYLPRECIPMLPEKLSQDLCSLREGVPRLVLVAEIRFSPRGVPVQARFFKGCMLSHKRMTYEQVQDFFDGGKGDLTRDVANSLVLMKKLAEILQRRSRARGAMALDLPETEILLDAQGGLTGFRRVRRLFSHKLIEEFMIAANVAVAALFARQGLPQLFRVHDSPDTAKLENFLSLLRGAGLRLHEDEVLSGVFLEKLRSHPLATYLKGVYLRSLKQAVYDPENRGHFGLALKDYCHFTSPIRRYPDLVVHRQLRSLLEQTRDGVMVMNGNDKSARCPISHSRLPYTFRDLTAIGRQSSRRERDAAETEREVMDLEKAFYMQAQIGLRTSGTVSRITRFGAFVMLDSDFVEGLLPLATLPGGPFDFDAKRILIKARRGKRVLRIGDRVQVELKHVEISSHRIELAMTEGKHTSRHSV